MKTKNIIGKYWQTIFFIVCISIIYIQCTDEEKVVIKEKVEIKTVHDTITQVKISKPKKVYIKKTDTITVEKGVIENVFTYPNKDSIKTNKYKVSLKSNEAEADLTIFADNLHNVKGVINYPEKTITKEKTIFKNKSGLFLYGKSDINIQNLEFGMIYNAKNKILIGAGFGYNTMIQKPNINLTIGIKL